MRSETAKPMCRQIRLIDAIKIGSLRKDAKSLAMDAILLNLEGSTPLQTSAIRIMSRRLSVESVVDDNQVLEVLLNQITAQGGRIVQVIWQPAPAARCGEQAGDAMLREGGFVVISEHGRLFSIGPSKAETI